MLGVKLMRIPRIGLVGRIVNMAVTKELNRGNPMFVGGSKRELLEFLKVQNDVAFTEKDLRPMGDGKWMFVAVKGKKS